MLTFYKAKLNGDTIYNTDNNVINNTNCQMRNSLTKNLYVQPRKSTVILSSNDVITCFAILDVTNFDLRTRNKSVIWQILPWLPEVLVSPPVISALYLWGGEENLWRHAILLSLPLVQHLYHVSDWSVIFGRYRGDVIG